MKKCEIYEPKKCWVGENQKICYATREEAEAAARVAEYDHGISGLTVYKCEYGDHCHLTTVIRKPRSWKHRWNLTRRGSR